MLPVKVTTSLGMNSFHTRPQTVNISRNIFHFDIYIFHNDTHAVSILDLSYLCADSDFLKFNLVSLGKFVFYLSSPFSLFEISLPKDFLRTLSIRTRTFSALVPPAGWIIPNREFKNFPVFWLLLFFFLIARESKAKIRCESAALYNMTVVGKLVLARFVTKMLGHSWSPGQVSSQPIASFPEEV